ncbi:hypothetical protein O5D80_001655 [Batrachochytrium dendrobatidis]|nr:hypothetical protein O5D80_001655 [Batrachochytrium dendrobatidis]
MTINTTTDPIHDDIHSNDSFSCISTAQALYQTAASQISTVSTPETLYNLLEKIHSLVTGIQRNGLAIESMVDASALETIALLSLAKSESNHLIYLSEFKCINLLFKSVFHVLESTKKLIRTSNTKPTTEHAKTRNNPCITDEHMGQLQKIYSSASIAAENLMASVGESANSINLSAKEWPAILMLMLQFVEFAHVEHDFALLNHGWKHIGILLAANTQLMPNEALGVICMEHLDTATRRLTLLPLLSNDHHTCPEKSLSALCSLAKFFLAHLNHLIKIMATVNMLSKISSVFTSAVANILFVVTQCTLDGMRGPDSVLLQSVYTTLQFYIHSVNQYNESHNPQSDQNNLDTLVDAYDKTNTVQHSVSAGTYYAVKALLCTCTLPMTINSRRSLPWMNRIEQIFHALESSDSRLLVLPIHEAQPMYTDILVSFCVFSHGLDRVSEWPQFEHIFWRIFFNCTQSTTWLLITEFFGHVSRNTKSTKDGYTFAKTMVSALIPRLASTSPLFPRMTRLACLLGLDSSAIVLKSNPFLSPKTLMPDSSALLLSISTNADLVKCLCQFELIQPFSTTQQYQLGVNDQNMASLINLLYCIWTRLCHCLDTESDVSYAVVEFQRLALVAVPLARIIEWDFLKTLSHQFPLSCKSFKQVFGADNETFKNVISKPLLLYIEGASGALEHSKSMNNPGEAFCLTIKACIALTDLACSISAKFDTSQAYRILCSFDVWMETDVSDSTLVFHVLRFIRLTATHRFNSLVEVSRILDRIMQSKNSDWVTIHTATQTAIAFASVSPIGAPKLSAVSRSLVQELLSRSAVKPKSMRLASTVAADTLLTIKGYNLKSHLIGPITLSTGSVSTLASDRLSSHSNSNLMEVLSALDKCLQSKPKSRLNRIERQSLQQMADQLRLYFTD